MPTATTTISPDETPKTRLSPALGGWPPERVVLGHLLDQHPRRLTLLELSREVGDGLEDVEVRRAVGNLAAASLLVEEGAELVPAPAVVRFDRAGVRADPR